MKLWVLLVCAVRRRLEDEVDRVDKEIFKTALNPHLPAKIQSDRVVELINRKNMLINLKVLYDRLSDALGEDKVKLLSSASGAKRVEKYLTDKKLTPYSYSRRLQLAAEEGVAVLCGLGFCPSKMREDYGDLFVVRYALGGIVYTLDSVEKAAGIGALPPTRIYSSASL